MKGLHKVNRQTGFTIVELLIVIVVIAILTAISVVAYRGIQVQAHNALRLAEAQEWAKLFSLYGQEAGAYPTADRYCLGRDFPRFGGSIGRCWDAVNGAVMAHENEAIMQAFETATGASLPNYGRLPITESGVQRLGPVYWGNSLTGVHRIKYFLESATGDAANATCPVGEKLWHAQRTYSCIITAPET